MQMPEGNNNRRLVAFGEFLLRLHSNKGQRFLQTDGFIPYYAGAEANVCVLLARLGIPVAYVSRVPDNDLAHAGLQQLRGQGVDTGQVLYGGDKLGLYFTEPGNGIRPSRVIYDRTDTSYAALQPGDIPWKNILQPAGYFHWSGVAAALSAGAADVCNEALTVAQEAGLTISADFNYRSTLWKYGRHPSEVMPQLLQHSHVAVADLDAVQVYYGLDTDRSLPLEKRFEQCVNSLQPHLPKLRTLGMSFRRTEGHRLIYSGALAHKGQYYFSEGFVLPEITDQIGTGDAFTAGMLYGLMNGYDPQTIIDFATACGTLKQSIPGDWALIHKSEVEGLMKNGMSGRIIR